MAKFTINQKEYNTIPFTFNLVCDLEDMGITVDEMGNKQMKMIRSYFALCAGISPVEAGKEIESHIVAGGNLGEFVELMTKETEKSGFFQATQNQENPQEVNQ